MTKVALITVLTSCCLGVLYGSLEATAGVGYMLLGMGAFFWLPLFVSRVAVLCFFRPRKSWQIFVIPLAVSVVGFCALLAATFFILSMYSHFGWHAVFIVNALGGYATFYFLILAILDAIALSAAGSLKHKTFWPMCLMNLAIMYWIRMLSTCFTCCP